ncbi:unnamed protein product [Pedinophyceae sp. YPF-701]|nr:unnamed protein product [Pedinophyceae sp. YPF-701]
MPAGRADQGGGAVGATNMESARRETRANLRQINDVVSYYGNAASADPRANRHIMTETLQRLGEVIDGADRPRELAMGTQQLAGLSDQIHQNALRQFASANRKSAADLVQALLQSYGAAARAGASAGDDVQQSGFDWTNFGEDSLEYFDATPGLDTMLGSMLAPAKERKAREAKPKKRDAPIGATVRPQDVEHVDDELEKQDTDRNMEEMWKLLTQRTEGGQRVMYYELVMNTTSFAQFVENAFTLSFLVRDGRVELKDYRDGDFETYEVVPVVGRKGGERHGEAQDAMQQFVSSFNMHVWRDAAGRMSQADCIMPHRDSAAWGNERAA